MEKSIGNNKDMTIKLNKIDKSQSTLLENILNEFSIKNPDVRQYSPLALAYIGDGIYDLVIRTIMVEQGNAPVNKLHKRVSSLVKAATQAKIIHLIEPVLTEEEIGIYKRGRNAKSFTSAKNASITEYRQATGFEALLGYLYLKDDIDRILQLIRYGLEHLKQ